MSDADIDYSAIDAACRQAYAENRYSDRFEQRGQPMPKATIYLGRARMWDGHDDADFGCWVQFVERRMGDQCEIITESIHSKGLDVVYASRSMCRQEIYDRLDELFKEYWGD